MAMAGCAVLTINKIIDRRFQEILERERRLRADRANKLRPAAESIVELLKREVEINRHLILTDQVGLLRDEHDNHIDAGVYVFFNLSARSLNNVTNSVTKIGNYVYATLSSLPESSEVREPRNETVQVRDIKTGFNLNILIALNFGGNEIQWETAEEKALPQQLQWSCSIEKYSCFYLAQNKFVKDFLMLVDILTKNSWRNVHGEMIDSHQRFIQLWAFWAANNEERECVNESPSFTSAFEVFLSSGIVKYNWDYRVSTYRIPLPEELKLTVKKDMFTREESYHKLKQLAWNSNTMLTQVERELESVDNFLGLTTKLRLKGT